MHNSWFLNEYFNFLSGWGFIKLRSWQLNLPAIFLCDGFCISNWCFKLKSIGSLSMEPVVELLAHKYWTFVCYTESAWLNQLIQINILADRLVLIELILKMYQARNYWLGLCLLILAALYHNMGWGTLLSLNPFLVVLGGGAVVQGVLHLQRFQLLPQKIIFW